ncbi:N, N'-diacetylbacillosaminyl-diphospho-undecaprenol alpha-1,3-N-acetylgalactosaminyltransferase [Pandoraea morbifera]|uniref:N, N'-diacetylbacillosaminyl-diphospho-undecaprenol alpha-1,3-N-acetylgalactosaminyltransferase n=1 Tax=Pandoraea morbifera TaxID=2508300 RepID=A0A5E4U752_9BURK|nr:glycosyltransferase family 4 protein [Pandoraea morbifera]VVD94898.1 N, N'-diacetylbacillosaminyl-diphospho-undecaprenol alpha-1,3-N-acetylgalactosaminyltransferase [Pandoraea morbifera]
MNAPVLFCSNTFWSIYNFRGGPIRALMGHGHPIHVVAPDDDYAPLLRDLGCAVHVLPMASKGRNPLEDLALLWRMYRLYRRIRPAVCFHYTIKPNIYGAIAAHLAGIESVSITTGLGTVFINQSVITHIVRTLYRYAFRHTRENWLLNESDFEAMVSGGLVDIHKARLLPGEGVDLDHFASAPWPAEDGTFRFLLIARLLRDKGVLEFVEAARQIRALMPHVRFQLLGPADVENPTAISRSQVDSWVREGLVEYLGVTQEVRPFIAQAHCVVLPSYREGLSRTLMEASAMARPVVTTDVHGCREVVGQGTTGWVVPAQNVAALAKQMIQVASMPASELAAIGRAGRAKVAQNFDERLVIAEYFRIIGELGRRTSPRQTDR